MNHHRLLILVCFGLAVSPCRGGAQEVRWVDAKVESRAAGPGLDKEFRSFVARQMEPAWVGYSMAAVAGNHRICCYSSEERHKPDSVRRGSCRLEGRDDGMNFQTNGDGDVLKGSENILVLFRIADRSVGTIRIFTDDCELDAGGLQVRWLTGVQSKDSIDLLSSFVDEASEQSKPARKRQESAIAAIALHADPAADRALGKFVDSRRPEEVRKNTAFWLGSLRGEAGHEILRRMIREDPSDKVREHCTFALSVSKVPEALNTLIESARDDKSTQVRGQALFWLAQKAGEKAAKAISDAIETDPETEVKKKAVFALSQLPKDQGVPKLIGVARKNRNREVRKDAMFWLGQSNDERALAFFEEVLTK